MGFRLEFQEAQGNKTYALDANMEENKVLVKVKNSTNHNLTIVS